MSRALPAALSLLLLVGAVAALALFAGAQPAQAQGAKTYSVADLTALEGELWEITITLSEAAPTDGLEFTYSFSYPAANPLTSGPVAGSDPNQDFIPLDGTAVTVHAGGTTAVQPMLSLRDQRVEPDERLFITFTPTGANAAGWAPASAGANRATLTLKDETVVVSLSKANYTVTEGDDLTVSLSPSRVVRFQYMVNVTAAEGTATRGVDFGGPEITTVMTPADAPGRSFTVSTTDDSSFESHETYTLTLQIPPTARDMGVIAGAITTATVRILDNDVGLWSVEAFALDDGKMKIQWSGMSNRADVVRNEAEYKLSTSNTWISAYSGDDFTTTVTGLTAGATYNVRARVVDTEGNSAWKSASATFTTAPQVLSGLTVSDGTNDLTFLPQQFDGSDLRAKYVVKVAPGLRSVYVTVTWEGTKAGVTVATTHPFGSEDVVSDHIYSSSGEKSVALDLDDANTTTLTVNYDAVAYNIYLQRAGDWASADNYLRRLTLARAAAAQGSPGAARADGRIALHRDFNDEVYDYQASVGYEVERLNVEADPHHADATTTVNGRPAGEPQRLAVGRNRIEVEVTAENGAQRTYTVVVNRAAADPERVAQQPPETEEHQPQARERAPGPVRNLRLVLKDQRIRVSWDAPAGGGAVQRYRVELQDAEGGPTRTRLPGAKKQYVVFRNLPGGASYEVSVSAKNAAGQSESVSQRIELPQAAQPQSAQPQAAQPQDPEPQVAEPQPQQPEADVGPEPANVQVAPGDGTLTVSWTVTSRDGVSDGEIRHALRWSQQSGAWANPTDRRAGGPEDGITLEGGVYRYTITGLENGTATGVFVRSFTGSSYSERSVHSSQWVRLKGDHTTPVAE